MVMQDLLTSQGRKDTIQAHQHRFHWCQDRSRLSPRLYRIHGRGIFKFLIGGNRHFAPTRATTQDMELGVRKRKTLER